MGSDDLDPQHLVTGTMALPLRFVGTVGASMIANIMAPYSEYRCSIGYLN